MGQFNLSLELVSSTFHGEDVLQRKGNESTPYHWGKWSLEKTKKVYVAILCKTSVFGGSSQWGRVLKVSCLLIWEAQQDRFSYICCKYKGKNEGKTKIIQSL